MLDTHQIQTTPLVRAYTPNPEESQVYVPVARLTRTQAELVRQLLLAAPQYRWFRNKPCTQAVCGIHGYWLSRVDERGCDLFMFRDPEDLITFLQADEN